MIRRPWEDLLFAAAVASNVALTVAVGVEIAQQAPVRILIATLVTLLLTMPWTSWSQTTREQARLQREVRARETRIVGSVERMKLSLTTDEPTRPPAPPSGYQRASTPDPWSED